MPRMIRLEVPGSIAHVMAHGIDGTNIFRDDEDRHEFLRRLIKHKNICGFRCYGLCLMDNHYHMLLRVNEKPLSKLLRPLNGGYARWFNRKYGRRGYLFQDRFKSILCQDLEYVRQLIQYIHLNPVRAGIVHSLDKLNEWKWCTHASLLNKRNQVGLITNAERNEVLRRFGVDEQTALKNYSLLIEKEITQNKSNEAGGLPETEWMEFVGSKKGWPAIVGDPDFVKNAMVNHTIGMRRKHRKADYLSVLNEYTLKIAKQFSMNSDDLFIRGRDNARSKARMFFCYKVHEEELIPVSIIAQFLSITIPSVMALIRHGREI
jgi:putative transposase